MFAKPDSTFKPLLHAWSHWLLPIALEGQVLLNLRAWKFWKDFQDSDSSSWMPVLLLLISAAWWLYLDANKKGSLGIGKRGIFPILLVVSYKRQHLVVPCVPGPALRALPFVFSSTFRGRLLLASFVRCPWDPYQGRWRNVSQVIYRNGRWLGRVMPQVCSSQVTVMPEDVSSCILDPVLFHIINKDLEGEWH